MAIDPKSIKYYFLNINLGETRTGIENSSLLRARLFHNVMQISPTIVTVAYNPRLNVQREKIYKNELLHESSKIINMYEYFQKTNSCENGSQAKSLQKQATLNYTPVKSARDFRAYNDSGSLVMYQKYNDNGELIFINIFANKKIVRRDTYDSNGFLSKTQYLNSESGLAYAETYYRTDGSVCIYKHFDIKEEKSVLTGIHLTNSNAEIVEFFNTETDFIAYWLKLLFEPQFHYFLIIDKERIYYPALLLLDNKNVSKVCMIHSSHLRAGEDDLHGKINSNYKRIFEDLSIPDAVVILTNRQKKHIEERFGHHENLFVISHSVEKIETIDFAQRKKLNVVYLARYSEEKHHASLVRIFAKVVQLYPEAKLSFYGAGAQKTIIKKLVQSLNLEGSIYVNGFVDDIDEIYNNADLAILPSRIEGFPLFILESIAHGCPFISYDICYGPEDMIDQGINGYLVEKDNEEEMFQRIIELFNDEGKRRKMSEASYKKAQTFQSEAMAEKWQNLISEVLKR